MSKLGKKIKKSLSGVARVTAATITGGASEAALYGLNKYTNIREDSAAQAATQAAEAQQSADLQQYYGYNSLADLTNARKKKEEELEQRKKATGIASLLGSGTTLG